jgi:hypothetical protein
MVRFAKRCVCLAGGVALLVFCGCSRSAPPVSAQQQAVAVQPDRGAMVAPPIGYVNGVYRGFDRNTYPGDDVMSSMQTGHAAFAFTGYWLTNPPGAHTNGWQGKRALLKQQGWGFLVLANGRLDAEILAAQRRGVSPAQLARSDAAIAVAAAQREGFPPHTILFLDQEEGGRLLDEQLAYLLGWTEAVAAGEFLPGVYASGQPVPDGQDAEGRGRTITTIDNIRQQVQAKHLHSIAMFDAQDACPPAPGCTLNAKPLAASGEPELSAGGNLIAWQYSQTPRRPSLTQSCSATYAADGNCYAPGSSTLYLDMDAAGSADPSHGR